jgi:hypothetical protein
VRVVVDWIASDSETWLHAYVRAVWRGHAVRGSIGTAILVFGVGLVIAIAGSFSHLYLTSFPIYYGTVGIAWVAYWGTWGDRALRAAARDLPGGFARHSDAESAIRREMTLLLRGWNQVALAVAAWCAAIAYVGWRTTGERQLELFDRSWSEDDVVLKNLILDIYALPILLLATTMIDGVIRYVRILHRVGEMRLAVPLEVAKIYIRPFAGWGTRTGFAWLLGITTVVLFTVPAYREIDTHRLAVALPALVGLSAAGVWAFFLLLAPQFVFHRSLRREVRRIALLQRDQIRDLCGGQLPSAEQFYDRTYVGVSHEQITDGIAALRNLDATSTWLIARPTDWIVFIATAVVPLLPLLHLLPFG